MLKCGEEIKREINKAPFVTVMVDKMTDACNAVQLTLILRYVQDLFAHLNGMAAFFSRSPKHTQPLDNICQWCIPHVAPTR